jgi:uncharacterized protein (DUF2147 family)
MIRITLAAALLVLSAAAASADPTGVWNAPKARVRVADCGAGLCATVISIKEPLTPEGKPKLDIYNADRSKRGRPVVGISILSGMKRDGDRWLGQIYNPEDGKTYKAYMTPQGDGKLKVQGCVLGGWLCKSQTWTRAQ